MNKEKYIKSVIQKLKCSGKKKKEIKRELESNLQTALENGEVWQEIKDRMGDPSSIAMEFNQNFTGAELKSYKRTKRLQIIVIIVVILSLIIAGIYTIIPKTYNIDKSSVFNKDKVITQAESIIELLNKDDYDTIKNQYADTKMAKVLEGTVLADAKKQIGSDWGEFKSFTSVYTAEIKQMGKHYAVAQITALYDNRSVTYTISFDEGMKLAGLFMK